MLLRTFDISLLRHLITIERTKEQRKEPRTRAPKNLKKKKKKCIP